MATVTEINSDLAQVQTMIEDVWGNSSPVIRLADQSSIQSDNGNYDIVENDSNLVKAHLCKNRQMDQCKEGLLNGCNENAFCTYTDDSYRCECQPGYVGDGTSCNGT